MANTYNFNAGPGALPREVLQEAQEELRNYQGIGASILEISHRSRAYESIHHEAQQLIKELMNLSSDYEVLFLHGGASLQFSMVPLNFLTEGKVAGYIHCGTWSGKAWQEAQKIGKTLVLASGEKQRFKQMPELSKMNIPNEMAYVHLTSNETIDGIQCRSFPDTGHVPLVVDMSSDIFSRPLEPSRFSLIYAGAQKNLGPAGVTIVIIHRSLLEHIPENIPDILSYRTQVKHHSLYNTPPVFSVYMLNLVLKWIVNQGGVQRVAIRNQQKADLLYQVLDNSGGFYKGLAYKDSRSVMNVTFRAASSDMENKLLSELEQEGFLGLKGHQAAGHLRASIYNAVPYEHCKALADFLTEFQKRNG
ncbi:3-phosphoserine/phosphohydroxythreonine transaminase [Bacillaceae bacterium SIJ1]|uniref:3-phosphoserine/phosphohydroxythreonine transaminase n=1 Tax=Litoribacterium kuwaitense TaxID=1398745 RepID=UPI0013EA367D|nr:3-phosphoserine/phosphohydroxythreonine transaminase [Litoribacterium kuwaitense]NGP45109.1 3-phosphoserine/phosphohydroxythreonine transaminase [Litoribacterium kuwaitense]